MNRSNLPFSSLLDLLEDFEGLASGAAVSFSVLNGELFLLGFLGFKLFRQLNIIQSLIISLFILFRGQHKLKVSFLHVNILLHKVLMLAKL